MAVEIGVLRALLSLDSAAFEKGAKRAQASMNGLQRSMSRTSQRLGRIGRQMSARVTAPIVASVGLMARSAVRSAAEIERLSQVANANTTEFQRFAAGARDVGIEQDKLADILKDTNDRVGDFLATGGGPMADFFENIAPKVGVTADEFKGLSGPQALQLYVSSLEKANLNQQEMTFYMEAIASDATLLLPLLRNSGEEMGRLGDAAENAGAIMDEKTVKALLRSRDAMREAGDAAKGLFNQLMASLAPVIETVAEKVGEAARWFSDLSPQMRQMIGVAATLAAAIGPLAIALGFVATGIAAIASPIGLAVLAFGALAAAVTYVAVRWDEIRGFFSGVWESISSAAEAGWNRVKSVLDRFTPQIVKDAWAGIVTWFDEIWAAIGAGVAIGWSAIKGMLDGTYSPQTLIKDAWAGITDWFRALWSDVEAVFAELWERIKSEVSQWPARMLQIGRDMIQGLIDGIQEKWIELKSSIRDTAQSIIDQTRGIFQTRSPSRVFMDIGRDLMGGLSMGISDNASKAAEAAAEAAQQVTDVVDGSTDMLGSFRDGAKALFRDVLTGAKSFKDAMIGVLSDLGNRLINSGIDMLFDAFFPSAGASPVFAGPTRPQARPFAKGGVVSGPTVFPMANGGVGLMGEAGPEAIMPLTRIGGALGVKAQVPEVHMPINIYNETGAQVTAERRDGRLDIAIRSAVSETINGGGADKAMRQRFGLRPRAQGA